ncbi:MAG: DUF2239 family protein [bacterium]
MDAARKAGAGDEHIAAALDATHRFLWDFAGDLPGFEEATRALFARDFAAFDATTSAWSADLRAALIVFRGPPGHRIDAATPARRIEVSRPRPLARTRRRPVDRRVARR